MRNNEQKRIMMIRRALHASTQQLQRIINRSYIVGQETASEQSSQETGARFRTAKL